MISCLIAKYKVRKSTKISPEFPKKNVILHPVFNTLKLWKLQRNTSRN